MRTPHFQTGQSNAPTQGQSKDGSETAESDLDTLLQRLNQRQAASAPSQTKMDRIQLLRDNVRNELSPIFADLQEKYAESGIHMEMDASNLLDGGREIQLWFSFGRFRSRLHGIATPEVIAFQETRYTPDIEGELTSGPSLRLRTLTPEIFREFICQRLALLLKGALRRRQA